MNQLLSTAAITVASTLLANGISNAKAPGQAIDDMMHFVGFGKLHELAEKSRAKQKQNIEKYSQEIAYELTLIDDENYQIPDLSIIGPALDASRFYVDHDIIRNMFVKLIANACDSSKCDDIHHSYVEIIKQLSPLDALLLKEISSSKLNKYGVTPKIERIDGSYLVGPINNYKLIDFPSFNLYSPEEITQSLDNLERLALIVVRKENFKPKIPNPEKLIDYVSYDEDKSDFYFNSTIYQELLELINSIQEEDSSWNGSKATCNGFKASMTVYGSKFTSICLSNDVLDIVPLD